MSQASSFGFPRTGPATPIPSFPNLDDSLKALLSHNSGTSPPSYAVKGAFWADTNTSGFVTLKMYDGADWISLCIVDETANSVRWFYNNPEATLASASTIDLLATTSENIVVTGTTNITSFGTAPAGLVKRLRFSATLQIVNSSSLTTPTGSNIVTSSNDACVALSLGSGNWRILQYISAVTATSLPVGMVSYFPTEGIPSGWLKANGAAVSRGTYANLFNYLVTSASFTAQPVTIATGTPAVFTKTSHGMLGGERIRFSTTGALPTGISSSVDYYVIKVSNDTFNVSLSIGGSTVTATGTQSGSHSYLQSYHGIGDGSTTFNLPDLRGEFIRGWDDGRTIDTSRVLGSLQLDAFQGHKHRHYIAAGVAAGSGSGTFSAGNNVASGDNSAIREAIADANGTPRIANETRPRSVALLACIKF